ncbi:MAG TPA: deoxyribodipyrimidine photo-lyase [Candidatus Dormibacteraeota bacterium]|nr:deoxyribodipyrimidine photo-lyase [Candidatus Dormibacteraeota bacterium]
MAECVIHWFRRDLRLQDNMALEAALRTGVPVIPVFILDARILAQPTMGERRLQFLRTALLDLDEQLRGRGSRLLVLHSEDVARELNRVAEETGAWALFFNRDYTPYARWRDTRATRGMQMTGVVSMPMDDLLLVPPLQTIGEDEHLPQTFGAFSRRWFAAFDLTPEPTPAEGVFMAAGDQPAGAENWAGMLAPDLEGMATWPGSTPSSAAARVRRFVETGLAGYDDRRDIPADEDGSSRLSAALKFGTLSVRRLASRAIALGARQPAAQPSVERFIKELAWREFAAHLLFDRPELLRQPLRTPRWSSADAGDARQPEASPARMEAWMSGRTGIPLVDAGMRQLRDEGWMHNRVRMVVASFLAHQMGGDWRAGERHFARNLVDLDVASNDLGWQWAVGVGVDAAPYRRTFNPRLQGEKFDPAGDYVRRYVPELAKVPAAHIHHPWDMSTEVQAAAGCRLGIDYPNPVVPVSMARPR